MVIIQQNIQQQKKKHIAFLQYCKPAEKLKALFYSSVQFYNQVGKKCNRKLIFAWGFASCFCQKKKLFWLFVRFFKSVCTCFSLKKAARKANFSSSFVLEWVCKVQLRLSTRHKYQVLSTVQRAVRSVFLFKRNQNIFP